MESAWIALGIAAIVLCAMVGRRIRFQNLAAARTGENFGTFRAAFAADDVSDDLLRAVYIAVQEWCPVEAFPVRADDDIDHFYSIDEYDFDYAVRDVLKRLGREVPPIEKLPRPIVTVRDFVLFVTECPPIDPPRVTCDPPD